VKEDDERNFLLLVNLSWGEEKVGVGRSFGERSNLCLGEAAAKEDEKKEEKRFQNASVTMM
jgi:hypothetical protein